MAHKAKTLTRVKYEGKSYGVGETVEFKSADAAKPYLAAGAIEAGEDSPELTAAQTTLGGANPSTGQAGVGPNRADIPADQLKGKRSEREALPTGQAGNATGAATPAGRDATPPAARTAGGEQTGTAARTGPARSFDYNAASVDEVEAEFKTRGLTATGTGKEGNLLKADMVKALDADDQARTASTGGTAAT
jgi:hypothetical protein